MSAKSLLDPSRFNRAKKISSKKVKEFVIVSEEPLIAYTVIQGSSKDPYIVVIDEENHELSHICPDYRKRSIKFCKHVGKLFLLIEQSISLNTHTMRNLRKNLSNAEIKLQELKMSHILTDEDVEPQTDFSIEDGVKMLCDGVNDENLVNLLEKKITFEFQETNDLVFLLSIHTLLNPLSLRHRKKIREELGKFLTELINNRIEQFVQNLTSKNFLRSLEIAYIYGELTEILKITPITCEISEDLPERIQEDMALILDLMRSKSTGKTNPKVAAALKRAKRIANFHGSHVPNLINKLQKNSGRITNYIQQDTMGDGFLIYLLKNNNEKINHKLYWKDEIARFPVKLVEEYPAFIYALSQIKGSEREYITYQEYKRHRVFFDFIEKQKEGPVWIERPRVRDESLFDKNGFIVQWELNLSRNTASKFYAMRDNIRLEMNRSISIHNTTQPFDYTLNDRLSNRIGKYIEEVTPKNLLVADQVVALVMQGVQIISNILPWNVLYNFASNGYLNQGDVSIAIKKCMDHQFVYGAYELQTALRGLALIGKAGISNQKYQNIQQVIKNSTGRLNSETRPILHELVISEGEGMQNLLRIVSQDLKEHLMLVMKACKIAEDVSSFRVALIKEVIGQIKKQKDLSIDFNGILEVNLGLYHAFNVHLRDYINKEFTRFNKAILKDEKQGIDKMKKHALGKLVLAKFGGSSSSAIDAESVKKTLENIISI